MLWRQRFTGMIARKYESTSRKEGVEEIRLFQLDSPRMAVWCGVSSVTDTALGKAIRLLAIGRAHAFQQLRGRHPAAGIQVARIRPRCTLVSSYRICQPGHQSDYLPDRIALSCHTLYLCSTVTLYTQSVLLFLPDSREPSQSRTWVFKQILALGVFQQCPVTLCFIFTLYDRKPTSDSAPSARKLQTPDQYVSAAADCFMLSATSAIGSAGFEQVLQ